MMEDWPPIQHYRRNTDNRNIDTLYSDGHMSRGNNNNWFSYQRSRRNFGNNSQDARNARNHAKKDPYRGSHPHEHFYPRVPSNPPNEEEFVSDSSRNNRFRNQMEWESRWKERTSSSGKQKQTEIHLYQSSQESVLTAK
ncbi:hypothetical protein ACOMHN_056326 [Nucella lapillus]